jgi:RHS repeat-associated protein
VAASYAYNGMGDRLSETANGQTTHYTMDLNAGLTQVLQDGTNTYLYGAGRVAQYGANGPDYYLGDALGSVRQMVDGSGNVTLGRNYKPYGGVLSSMGGGATSYGFTNEWTDASTGDVYLRARWYAPGQGRFLTKDTWEGDYSRPMSLNGWGYVEGNPIIRIDPSGYVSLHAEVVIRLAFTYILSPHYNIPSTIKPNPAYPGLRTGKWVDLADLGIREVYEVEPIDFGGKGYNPGHGVNQALDYVNLLNQGILPNEKLWTLGSRNLVDHWITWSGLVEVDTFTQAPGLVVFKATLSKKAQEICVDILITLLLTKGLIDIQGVSPRGPVPVTIPIT